MRKHFPWIGGVVVFGLWLLTLCVGNYFFPTWQERGQFGDLFGSVNALFSGLAFAGLIYAILLQHQELALQREELRLQRVEMAASRGELRAQVEAQHLLFRASIAQIRLSAEMVRVEATKMEAEMSHPGVRQQWVARIHESATTIEQFAAKLESHGT